MRESSGERDQDGQKDDCCETLRKQERMWVEMIEVKIYNNQVHSKADCSAQQRQCVSRVFEKGKGQLHFQERGEISGAKEI